jgi:hypothetical protein
MCHRYTNISLDREEPSRSHALPAGIVARYDELAERSWMHASRGGASRLYTRSTSQKPRNQTNIVALQKLERDKQRDREMLKRVICNFNPIYKVVELAMYARVQ